MVSVNAVLTPQRQAVRAKLLASSRPLTGYQWSSHCEYLKSPGKRVPWLRVDRLIGEMGIPQDGVAGRRQFSLNMEQRRGNEAGQKWKRIERGWCLGDETFRQKLLALAEGKFGANHYGGQRRESSEEKARRIVAEELRRAGWKHGELEKRLKADPEKLRIAQRLRGETTMTLKWIADELRMGAWTYLSNREHKGNKMEEHVPKLFIHPPGEPGGCPFAHAFHILCAPCVLSWPFQRRDLGSFRV